MSDAAAPAPAVVAVAFSGGLDSLALLHATCLAALDAGVRVAALHVHHGLMPQADAWLAQAQALCRRWQRRGWPVDLHWRRLDGAPARGDSIEAWARAGRHQALAAMAEQAGASLLLLAQHRRDQAETVLLQALRGGGPAGLSAMPRLATRDGLVWARPWLDQPRTVIEAYARRHRLQPIDDPSNADPALARSRLRVQVWPALLQSFLDAEVVLCRVAERAQEAAAVLAEVAQADLALLSDGLALRLAPWQALSAARRANALRAWLAGTALVRPTDALVQRLLRELPATTSAARWPAGDGQQLVRHRGLLTIGPSLRTYAAAARTRTTSSQPTTPPTTPTGVLDLSQPGRHRVPGWDGALVVTPAKEHGLQPADLVAVRPAARAGGERFALAPAALPRSLKKQFQAAGIAADDRAGPLLWSANRLLFVPGLGVDARRWAAAGVPQLTLRWEPAGPA